MTQKVTTRTIELKELLQKKNIHIPEYQRPYTWTEKNVVQLLDDVIRFSKYPEYRIGTIILHENGEKLDVVDGQQRIITSLLVAKSLAVTDIELTTLDIPKHEKTVENIKNNFKVIQDYLRRHPTAKEILEDYFLDHCTVVILQLTQLDEAFQLFDSANNRGKALYPTDLLKAFHLRELTGSEEKKREMVDLWENIEAEHIYILFSDYFYRIKQWSKNRPVREIGFSNKDIDLFKGISESDMNKHQNWSKAHLMAKNFVDNFNSQNETMIAFNTMEELHYPFQIDQPMINGEYFFKFVDYYYNLTKRLGFFEERKSANVPSTEIKNVITDLSKDNYFRYVNSLFKTAVLYVVDRFSDQEIEAIEKICFTYAYFPRFYLEQVLKKSINKFVIDSDAGIKNFFNHVAESFSINDILHFYIQVEEENLKNAQRIKRKNEKVYQLYFQGGTT